ncbi:MAG: hypothetical protein ACRD2K_05635 [Terriglobales bacterium]
MDPSELNIPGLRPPAPPSGDENVRGILRFGVWMVVAALVIYAVLFGMFQYFDRQAAAADPARNPLLAGEKPSASPAARFPQPQLQPNAAAELEKARAGEDEILASYGWVDRRAGVVRMPIDRAMQIIAERGVPVWPPAPPQPAQTMETKK